MERYTKYANGKTCCTYFGWSEECKRVQGHCCECKINDMACDKLREYEETEETDMLVKLPCKVGDIAYQISGNEIEKLLVAEFTNNGISWLVTMIKENGNIFYDYLESFGEEFFLTREEAENVLKLS